MNEQKQNGFEPPKMTVLTNIFNQDRITISTNSWSIGVIDEIPELNE